METAIPFAPTAAEPGFPWATLAVNVTGALVMGLLVAWLALLGVGFCGAFTTFSTFALELWDALRERPLPALVANLALSLVLGLGALVLAFAIADRLAG